VLYVNASQPFPHGGTLRGCNWKFLDWLPGMRTANGIALCQWVQLYRYCVSQSSEFCHHNPLFASQLPKVSIHFFINSVWKLLDTPSYTVYIHVRII
jgi:hypothetical protein